MLRGFTFPQLGAFVLSEIARLNKYRDACARARLSVRPDVCVFVCLCLVVGVFVFVFLRSYVFVFV